MTKTSGFGMLIIAFAHLHATVLQKPVREEVAYVDHAPAPKTVPDMVSAAAAVVVAEYTGRSRLIEEDAAHPIMTSYTFRLVETIKRHGALPLDGDEMEVELHWGRQGASHLHRAHKGGRDQGVEEEPYVRPVFCLEFDTEQVTARLGPEPLRCG
jgi:hypothetical protein